MIVNQNQFLWVEKYRPKRIADCILPAESKSVFQEYVDRKLIPNLLLTGTAGVGKTTVARAMCEEVGCDYMFIPASDERGIDTLRYKVKSYASSMSFSGGRKVIILDEADNLTHDAQKAFRSAIEEFAINCSFVLTANYPMRIEPAIQSRCSLVDFKLKNGNKPKMAGAFFKRIEEILSLEKVTYDEKVLVEVISKYFPDYRRTLNELQKYAVSGTIDVGILSQISDVSIKELIGFLKDKNFREMRKWVATNIDQDMTRVFRKIYDSLYEYLNPESIPTTVLTIAEYSYRSAFVLDQEINAAACFTNIMAEASFK